MILPDEPSEISSWLLISDWILPELAHTVLGYCWLGLCASGLNRDHDEGAGEGNESSCL